MEEQDGHAEFHEYTEIFPLEESDGTSKPLRAFGGDLHLLFVKAKPTLLILVPIRILIVQWLETYGRQHSRAAFWSIRLLLSPHQSREFLRDQRWTGTRSKRARRTA